MKSTENQKKSNKNKNKEPKDNTPEINTLSFEDCLQKVETLSDELESGGLMLSDALQKYKLAVAIMDRAKELLTTARDELQIIDDLGEKTISNQEILNK
tara:strand:+ start:4245 stop:4541 length:297 start_codon:yes stop_codon:yes gene_type:complete